MLSLEEKKKLFNSLCNEAIKTLNKLQNPKQFPISNHINVS